MKNIKTVGIFGDWHSNINFAIKTLNRLRKRDLLPDVYVHLGDFNFFPDKSGQRFLKTINNILIEQNRIMFVIDGNHEDFDYLYSIPVSDDGFRWVRSNIAHVPRGTRWTWNNKNFLGFGGAFSVDKRFRKEGFDWFSQEIISQKDIDKALNSNERVDIIFSHEAPILPINPKNSNLPWVLTDEEEYFSNKCRDAVAEITIKTSPRLLLHGHHHFFYQNDFHGTHIIGLDKDNAPSLRHNYFELNLDLL